MKFSPPAIVLRAALYLVVSMLPVFIDAIKSGQTNWLLTSLMATLAGATTLRAFIDQSTGEKADSSKADSPDDSAPATSDTATSTVAG